MVQLIAGRIAALVSTIVISAVALLYMRLAARGRKFELRRLSAFDAIDEAVARCTELKKPLHFTTGLWATPNAVGIAGLSLLGYISKRCAKYDTEMIITSCYYRQLPYLQGVVKAAFDSEGKTVPEGYFRYTGEYQWQLSIVAQGILEREKPGANIMLGSFDEECISIAEKGFRVGAMGIGGTQAIAQIAVMAAIMDYVLIGEELIAAGAYASENPVQMSSVAGGDLPKIAAIVLIILGAILVNLGVPFVKWLSL
jgi:hypothetical protein